MTRRLVLVLLCAWVLGIGMWCSPSITSAAASDIGECFVAASDDLGYA